MSLEGSPSSMKKHSVGMLPPGKESKVNAITIGRDNAVQAWASNAAETLERSMESPGGPLASSRRRGPGYTIRAVTPVDSSTDLDETGEDEAAPSITYYEASSPQASPRSLRGGEKSKERRRGLVFDDSYDAAGSSPINIPTSSQDWTPRAHPSGSPQQTSNRPRTRTLDEPRRRRQQTPPISVSRHRIGSVHSASADVHLENARPALQPADSSQSSQTIKPSSTREKTGKPRRLRKKASQSSPRPLSPEPHPSVGSLQVPVETSDANKILALMRTSLGRMRGTVEYRDVRQGPWFTGVCFIDDLKGTLVFEDEDRRPFHEVLVPDLRGCRVKPVIASEMQGKCLEISTSAGLKLLLYPPLPSDFDQWLAALLCWQQVGPGTCQISLALGDNGDLRASTPGRSPTGTHAPREGTIIKVGKLLLWDKGILLSPASIARRLANRDPRPARRAWKRVSCILKDNGEFKLLTENDVTLLSVIQLSQLSRSAIQRLDRSVLSEDHCIAIFPQYTSTSNSISIVRPVYIALESRVLFEVWFVLLRAFTIPELYGAHLSSSTEELAEDFGESDEDERVTDIFRVEKSLHIRIVEAKIHRSLPKDDTSRKSAKPEQDASAGDYYAEIILGGEVRSKTMTKYNTRSPFWREDVEFNDLPAALPSIAIVLKRTSTPPDAPLTTRSSTSIHSPEHFVETVCGVVEISLEQLERGKESEKWWPILDDNSESIGDLFLKVRHDETVVLMAKDYQQLSELLHRFSSGLTISIAQVVSLKLRILSETFMNIFQVSGQATMWLMALVEDEIDGIGKETPVTRFRFSRRVGSNDSFDSVSEREQSVRDMGKSLTGEANLLFRGNTLLTQALDFHMRRVGKEYLEEVLLDKISEITLLNPECEVDPSRLSYGDDIKQNWTTLISLTTSVWESIASSVKKCPAEVRQILKFIRAVADDRYGDFLRTVPYTSVTGFLFLRFFCPAILNPKLFGLLRDHPRPKAQRTLTLIAKSLQALANLSTFGQKEEWMEPMNRFLSSNRQRVKDFIDEICSISIEKSTLALPAAYSTPVTILSRLPPSSREGFPSLPYLIDHARNFAVLVKLWLDSNPHAAGVLEGDLLEFHKQCLALQQRTNECVRQAERLDTSGGPIEWDEVASKLSHSTLQSVSHHTSKANSVTNTDPDSATRFPPFTPTLSANGESSTALPIPGSAGSNTSNTTSSDRREHQTFWEQTFGGNFRRPYDPERELMERQSSPPPQQVLEPPSGGPSRNSKSSKSFFTGLRKKSIAPALKDAFKDRERERDEGRRPGSS
jgi:hypothetical protein